MSYSSHRTKQEWESANKDLENVEQESGETVGEQLILEGKILEIIRKKIMRRPEENWKKRKQKGQIY